MKTKLSLTVLLMFIGVVTYGQNIQQNWWSGRATKWYKNHNIILSQSGMTGGDFTFDFADPNDNSFWGVWSPKQGSVLTVRSNGKVGIGTDNPQAWFHIKTQTLIDTDVDWANGWRFNLKGAYHEFRIGSTKQSDAFFIANSKGDKILTTTGNGFVGINTQKPEKSFDVHGESIFRNAVSFADKGIFNNILTVKGKIGIGTETPEEAFHLVGNAKIVGDTKVSGNANFDGEIIAKRVSLEIGSFPDYVFEENYKLMSLYELESFINKNKHLPGVPSESEVVEKGLDVEKINTLLVEKVEELTLYTIDQQKKLDSQADEISQLKEALLKVQTILEKK
ncbi:MAG: hypothetical protein ACEPOW_03310 [Bacteroidales bacterium]